MQLNGTERHGVATASQHSLDYTLEYECSTIYRCTHNSRQAISVLVGGIQLTLMTTIHITFSYDQHSRIKCGSYYVRLFPFNLSHYMSILYTGFSSNFLFDCWCCCCICVFFFLSWCSSMRSNDLSHSSTHMYQWLIKATHRDFSS